MRTTVRFREVKRRREVKGVCHFCGKRTRRMLSDYQTVNPLNRDVVTGLPKSEGAIDVEVQERLARKVQKWEAAPTCSQCEA